MNSNDLKEVSKQVTLNPQNIFQLLMAGVACGGVAWLWEPAEQMIRGITDRQDVTNTILCTNASGIFDEDCLDNAWDNVLNKRFLDEAKHGSH